MKKIVILWFLLSCCVVSNAQVDRKPLYGAYIRHSDLGGYDAYYEFSYEDDRFTYCTDRYNSLTGSVCISGKCLIKEDSIFFYNIKVEIPVFSDLSRIATDAIGEERVVEDSTVTTRRRPTSSNFWSLTGAVGEHKYRTIQLESDRTFFASFFRHQRDEYIEIDGERFYEDPGPEGEWYEIDESERDD